MSTARFLTAVAGASAFTITASLVSSTGAAWADPPLAPRTTFTMVVSQADGTVAAPTDGEAIPNIDSVKSTIRAYYNASGGISNKTSSRYITQVRSIEHHILSSLPANHPAGQAVVFDVDDTLLWNYDFEDHATNFNFDPAVNGQWVTDHLFPAVPGMPQLLEDLVDRGYEIYGVTGRPAAQEADTVINLNNEGFPMFNAGNLYTKDVANQSWVDCNADGVAACSTVEYKAFTRQHIEDNGTPGDSSDDLDVVMNVGDQWSDLEGGYADDYTKIPNPTYFLASPDIPGAPASDANMVPPTSYVMQPDGSSGYSVASGDDIPNIDPVRKMIRGYYNASSSGIADKGTSNYINQLTSLESVWTPQVSDNCTAKDQARTAALQEQTAAQQAVTAAQAAVAKDTKAVDKAKKRLKKAKTKGARKAAHKKLRKAQQALTQSRAALAAAQAELAGITVPAAPAVVFDADDTTLWTYDMEDGAMKFVFDPVLQGTWVSQHLFPAVPGMSGLVQAAKAAGCAVFGLTGRGAAQQADTIANLTEQGYVDAANQPLFTGAHYFTKGAVTVSNSNASIPSQPWVNCGSDNACSTIEYKSGTRAHIEDLGFDIVGNFGDQWSDLIGEHADHVYKLPNATYYLP